MSNGGNINSADKKNRRKTAAIGSIPATTNFPAMKDPAQVKGIIRKNKAKFLSTVFFNFIEAYLKKNPAFWQGWKNSD
jgi:hypothetical protein